MAAPVTLRSANRPIARFLGAGWRFVRYFASAPPISATDFSICGAELARAFSRLKDLRQPMRRLLPQRLRLLRGIFAASSFGEFPSLAGFAGLSEDEIFDGFWLVFLLFHLRQTNLITPSKALRRLRLKLSYRVRDNFGNSIANIINALGQYRLTY